MTTQSRMDKIESCLNNIEKDVNLYDLKYPNLVNIQKDFHQVMRDLGVTSKLEYIKGGFS